MCRPDPCMYPGLWNLFQNHPADRCRTYWKHWWFTNDCEL